MAPLVEFAVVRQEHLGHHAHELPAVDDEAAIVEPPLPPQRRADDENRRQLAARRDEALDRAGNAVEHGVLKQEIVDRIGRQAQFGEHHQRDAGLVARGDQSQRLIGVRRRLGNRNPRHAGGDPHELVPVGREKPGHRPRRSRVVHISLIILNMSTCQFTHGTGPQGALIGERVAHQYRVVALGAG